MEPMCIMCKRLTNDTCKDCDMVAICSLKCRLSHRINCPINYISGVFYNGNFMGFLFSLLASFEVYSLQVPKNIGYIECFLTRSSDTDDTGYYYEGFFRFKREKSHYMDEEIAKNKNLILFKYIFKGKWQTICKYPLIDDCKSTKDVFNIKYKLINIKVDQSVKFVANSIDYLNIVADGIER